MNRLADAIVDHARWVIAASLGLLVLSLYVLIDVETGKLRLQIDPSSEVLFPLGGEARESFDLSRRMLGGDDPLVIVVDFDDVFAAESLQTVAELTEALEQLDGIDRVSSLSSAPTVRPVDGDIAVVSLMQDLPETEADRESLAVEILENPLYRGIMATEDRRSTALLVYVEEMPDIEFVNRRIDDQVTALAREIAGDDVFVSGFPHFKANMSASLQRDLAFALPLILVFLVISLYMAFRSRRGVWIPMAAIALSLVYSMAIVVALGGSLNVITTIVPPLILTLGFAYTMHVLHDYQHTMIEDAEARGEDPPEHREIVRHALREVAMPVLTTGLTTAAGFVALAISPIPAIRDFGIYSLLGVAVTVTAALSFTPAMLSMLGTPAKPVDPEASSGALRRMADAMASFAVRQRRFVLGGAVLLAIASAVGATQIVVASRFITSFKEEAPVRVEFEAINDRLGGANAIQILVDGQARNALLEPMVMRRLNEFQLRLEQDPVVGRVTSFVDYVMLLNRAWNEGDPAAFVVPENPRLTSQLLLLGASDESERMIDASNRIANITVLSGVSDSGQVKELTERISADLDEILPEGIVYNITGNMVLVSEAANAASRSQWQSLLVAFGIIFVVLALLFMSLRVAAVALLPNALPIAAYFGALGWTGVTLNTSTAVVGCLALGIAVDDTIHYFARFSREARRLGNELDATRSTLRALIHPVTYTTAGLCFGFLVLTTTQLKPQIEFGALAAFTLAIAWVVDVSLSPALCGGLKIVTLWDTLKLDLGENPQETIPLFEGLSANQARLFTLLTDLREAESGSSLMRLGDPAEDVFVVVDGELEAWVERNGQRVSLAVMGRGDVIGEVGHFGGTRTANVSALSHSRLIRIEPRDLDRIWRRRPRIAAAVYRNLNRIQAARMARITEKVA